MEVNAVKPGSIIKYEIPDQGSTRAQTKIYEVKANNDGQLYGSEIQDINKAVDKLAPLKKANFEVIA